MKFLNIVAERLCEQLETGTDSSTRIIAARGGCDVDVLVSGEIEGVVTIEPSKHAPGYSMRWVVTGPDGLDTGMEDGWWGK